MSTNSVTSSSHKRSKTYEGEQMTFKFPSEEDLTTTEQAPQLSGPPIQPYYIYEKSLNCSNPQSPTQAQQSDLLEQTFDYTKDGFLGLQSSPQMIRPQSYFNHNQNDSDISLISGHNSHLSVGTIPTEDNLSYQITSLSNPSHNYSLASAIVEQDIPHSRLDSSVTTRQYPMISRKPSSIIRKNSGRKRNNIRRTSAMSSDEDVSLFRKSSLKRSKAIKSKIGWLSKLKLLVSKLKSKIKNWRFIPQKKTFNYKGLKKSSTPVKKNRISMPLERETVQSISELKKTWYTINDKKVITVDAPPSARYQLIDTPRSVVTTQSPPQVPEHSFISNPSIPKGLSTRRERNSLFSTYNRAAQLEVVSISDQNSEIYAKDYPDSIVEEDEDESDDQSEYTEEEEEELVKTYWRSYLRKVVADRIESKLHLQKLTDNLDPEDEQDDATEMFSLVSDTGTMSDSGSDFSFCISAYSDPISDSSYLISENANNDEFSSYQNGPVQVPHDILKYEQQFIERYRHQKSVDIKRSLTDAKARSSVSVPITNRTHTRFLSSFA